MSEALDIRKLASDGPIERAVPRAMGSIQFGPCEQSYTVGQLAKALAAAQKVMGHAHKDSTNPHFKSKYADLASIREAAAPLAEHGVAVTQQVLSGEGGAIGVRTALMHESGEWMASSAYVVPRDAGPQAAGSVITYLRRYMLAAAAGIAQDDDDGNAGQRGSAPPAPPQKAPPAKPADLPPGLQPATPPSVKALAIEMAKLGIKDHAERIAWISGHLGRQVKSSKETSEAEIQVLIEKAKNGEAPPEPGSNG